MDSTAVRLNDMLKAISASLLMEQVLAPRYEFTPKDTGPKGFYPISTDGLKRAENFRSCLATLRRILGL